MADKLRVSINLPGKIRDFEPAPDGKRVLALTPMESAEPPKQEHGVPRTLLRRTAAAGARAAVPSLISSLARGEVTALDRYVHIRADADRDRGVKPNRASSSTQVA